MSVIVNEAYVMEKKLPINEQIYLSYGKKMCFLCTAVMATLYGVNK